MASAYELMGQAGVGGTSIAEIADHADLGFGRPDLLSDRLQKGFYKFGVRDLKEGIREGQYTLDEEKVDAAWRLQMWMLVGGVKKLFRSDDVEEGEVILIEPIMRAMGVPADHAREVARLPVPELPPAQLNFMDFRDAKLGGAPTAKNAR